MPIEGLHDDVRVAVYAAQVRGIVHYFAHHLKLLTTYGAIADALKDTPKGCSLPDALAMIAEEDHTRGRPLTTAVVVNHDTGIPGTGFFHQAHQLGAHDPGSGSDLSRVRRLFWRGQLQLMGVQPFTLEQSQARLAEDVKAQEGTQVLSRTFITPTQPGTKRGNTPLPGEIANHLKSETTVGPSTVVHLPVERLTVGMVVFMSNPVRDARRRMVTNQPVSYVVRQVDIEKSTSPGDIPSIVVWSAQREGADEVSRFRSPAHTHVKALMKSDEGPEPEPRSMLPGDECDMAKELKKMGYGVSPDGEKQAEVK